MPKKALTQLGRATAWPASPEAARLECVPNTRRGTVNMRNARHQDDPRPIDGDCACPACRTYSRAYIHHLIRSEEILGLTLLSLHNVHYYQDLMRAIRAAIEADRYDEFQRDFAAQHALGDIEPV